MVETVSRGKHLLTRIDGGPDGEPWTLHTHLKMEGAWRVYEPRAPVADARPTRPGWCWRPTARMAVGFSLGIVELLPRDREDDAVGHLGPDLLGPDWDEDEALRRLREDPDRPIGEALLDQTRLAGIGNMYMAELCFVTGVHPRTPVGEVPDLPRLVRRGQADAGAQQGARGAVHHRRPARAAADVGLPPGQEPLPPLRHPDPRWRWSGPAGRERASYWCPSCQPPPSPGGRRVAC